MQESSLKKNSNNKRKNYLANMLGAAFVELPRIYLLKYHLFHNGSDSQLSGNPIALAYIKTTPI